MEPDHRFFENDIDRIFLCLSFLAKKIHDALLPLWIFAVFRNIKSRFEKTYNTQNLVIWIVCTEMFNERAYILFVYNPFRSYFMSN